MTGLQSDLVLLVTTESSTSTSFQSISVHLSSLYFTSLSRRMLRATVPKALLKPRISIIHCSLLIHQAFHHRRPPQYHCSTLSRAFLLLMHLEKHFLTFTSFTSQLQASPGSPDPWCALREWFYIPPRSPVPASTSYTLLISFSCFSWELLAHPCKPPVTPA